VEGERVLEIPKLFGWLVSGTPFPDEYALRTTLRFTCNITDATDATEEHPTSLAALDYNEKGILEETKYSFLRSTVGVTAFELLSAACVRAVDRSLLPRVGVSHRLSVFVLAAAERLLYDGLPLVADFDYQRLQVCSHGRLIEPTLKMRIKKHCSAYCHISQELLLIFAHNEETMRNNRESGATGPDALVGGTLEQGWREYRDHAASVMWPRHGAEALEREVTP
jgi:hypothetical protein